MLKNVFEVIEPEISINYNCILTIKRTYCSKLPQ